jgi:ribosomal protein S18 acetylase RimI-like enzyme
MTHAQNDIIIRSITSAAELSSFCALDYVLNDELADDLAAGRRRPAWMWVALRGGRLVARAAWWGSGDDAAPSLLDVLDVADDPDRIEVGVGLLERALSEVIPAGARPPEYSRFIPPDWREHASTQRAVEDRMAIAARTGAQLLTERFRFEWRPGTPVAAPSGRLEFRPVTGDGELLDLMTLAMDGTLDAHSRQDLAVMSARQGAIRHFEDELACFTSPRHWWRIATLPGGEAAGFVIPARNNYHAIVAYLGVLPAHRGQGYVSEILAEGTRILAAQDVPRIRASTDLGNTPMAAAFTRAGWVNFERSISMTWP